MSKKEKLLLKNIKIDELISRIPSDYKKELELLLIHMGKEI